MKEYELSIASRFWGVAPYDLEEREDKTYWIARAITFKSAENMAEQIQLDRKQAKSKMRGKR